MRIPNEWSFKDKQVAEGFERHVRTQLPWYELVTGAMAHFARHYIPQGGLVYDIGASTGNVGLVLKETLKARAARFVAIEESPDMAKLYRGPGELKVANAVDFEFEEFDVAVCFLVVMFLPPAVRREWIGNLLGKCRHGGAIIVVDKIENPGGYFGTALARLTLAGKVSTGTSAEDIIAKELSLPGAQRPLEPGFIEFAVPGYARQFFQFGEFSGWVIESARR